MKIQKKKSKVILALIVTISFFLSYVVLHPDYALQEQYVDAIVFFEDGVTVDDIPGVDYKYRWASLNGFAGRMSYSTYKELEKADFVKSIELDQKTVRPASDEDELDWGVDDIDAERVWGGYDGATNVINPNAAGKGVKVCILDTGIRAGHEDLWYNYKGGYDFVDDDTNPSEGVLGISTHHGTSVAGIISAMDNNRGMIGVAPNVSLYVVRIFFSDTEPCDMSDVISGIDWAIDNEMDIISMSFTVFHYIGLAIAINTAYQQGIVLVAASGNDGENWISYPAADPRVIAVGAVQKVDGEYVRASYSNYGILLDLVAPTDVRTAYGYITKYRLFDGTSAAAPHVAGVCALILSEYPDLSPGEVKDILISSSIDLGPPWRDDEYGYGLVNAYYAVDNEPPEVTITSHNTGDWVKGIVSITASATDNAFVTKVAFKIDNGEWHDDTDGTDGWSYDWDSTGYTTGGHNIWSRAYDLKGLYGEDVVSVGVDNVPPSIDIINPSHSATVSGTIMVTASASDNTEVEKVQFFIDSVLKYEDTNGANGWTWNWDTLTSSEDNYHYVKVKAFDLADNYAEHQHTVFVNNFPSDPGPGCPILSVFNGTDYVVEGLLDIHNPEGIDVEAIQVVSAKPGAVNHRYLLRLTEFHKTISHIDQVKLFGRLHNGQLVPLHLISAVHSTLGQVRNWLWFSDDRRVDVYGADHIEGGSEFIDLKFIAPAHTNFVEFIFFIEGNNRLIK